MSEELKVIFAACAQGRTDIVQAAIESIRGGESKESSECIRELISSGRAEDSATPLHVASYSGHADVIRALLQAGADLSVTATRGDFLGRRPYEVATSIGKEAYHVFLIEAIVMNDIDRIATLLTGGVPATCADDSTKDTPLHWAASFGNSDIVQMLLDHGADAHCINAMKQTTLHCACKSSTIAPIQLLLTCGVDVNAVDTNGRTADALLSSSNFASVEEHEQAAKLLADMRATVAQEMAQETAEGAESADLFNIDTMDIGSVGSPLGSDTESQNQSSIRPQSHSQSNLTSHSHVQSQSHLPTRKASYSIDTTNTEVSLDSVRDLGSQRCEAEIDDFDERCGSVDGCISQPMNPILVLWPPPQRMARRGFFPLILSNEAPLPLVVPTAELETVSILIDALSGFAFDTEISSPSAGAIIKLSIDRNICPKNSSYELIIDPGQAQLVAADSAGLRYAVHSFVQLMQLHSDLALLEGSGVTVMKLPSISVSDWPDVESRAVLWSHRSAAMNKQSVIADMIYLFSKIRLNTLLLTIEPEVDERSVLFDEYVIKEIVRGLIVYIHV